MKLGDQVDGESPTATQLRSIASSWPMTQSRPTASLCATPQLQFAAQLDEAATDVANAGAVVTTEIGDGLEVWRQATGQPHEFEIALALALEPAA